MHASQHSPALKVCSPLFSARPHMSTVLQGQGGAVGRLLHARLTAAIGSLHRSAGHSLCGSGLCAPRPGPLQVPGGRGCSPLLSVDVCSMVDDGPQLQGGWERVQPAGSPLLMLTGR